jgi:hypothetical protein
VAALPGVIVSFGASPRAGATMSLAQAITLNDGTASTIVTLGTLPEP